jgi:hypothetical protein
VSINYENKDTYLEVEVVLIRHNDNTGSSSISTKDESCLSSSINDESGESLVDTTFPLEKFVKEENSKENSHI